MRLKIKKSGVTRDYSPAVAARLLERDLAEKATAPKADAADAPAPEKATAPKPTTRKKS